MTIFGATKLSRNQEALFVERSNYSQGKLDALKANLRNAEHTDHFSRLTIYAAGSYGRLEASPHSDIDLFFVLDTRPDELEEFHVPEIRLLSEIVDIGYNMDFPKFSNDGQFLRILFLQDLLGDLGSPSDDYNNHFTARMLLLLEGRPIYGFRTYSKILNAAVKTYFRDYPHHPDDFRPTFLINDIIRFWKTLCLNYEHKRNQPHSRAKIKHKIKNFKLGYSRLLTCFATVALLSTFKDTISPSDVVKICRQTPVERLVSIVDKQPKLAPKVKEALHLYSWFLQKTALRTSELENYFSERSNRQEAFDNARLFGNKIFDILRALDQKNNNLRYLVV